MPNLFLTDISTQVGDFYSRKLSYRIYTEQDEMHGPLFRDFMRRERNGRGKTTYRKRIPDNIEKYLTPRAIAHWYLDKGDYLCVDDPSRRRSLANNGVPRSGGMHVDEDDSPALLASASTIGKKRGHNVAPENSRISSVSTRTLP